jgi:hypothetical protein
VVCSSRCLYMKAAFRFFLKVIRFDASFEVMSRASGGRSTASVDKTKFNVDRQMFGQIPTIIPGRMWPDRMYCSEEACHCPPVCKIALLGSTKR